MRDEWLLFSHETNDISNGTVEMAFVFKVVGCKYEVDTWSLATLREETAALRSIRKVVYMEARSYRQFKVKGFIREATPDIRRACKSRASREF